MEISAQVTAGISAMLADARDRVVGEALAALNERDQAGCLAPSPAVRRQDMEHLFELIQRCVHEGHCEPIIGPSQQMAADHFAAGIEIAEIQVAFTVLEDVLWRHLADAVSGDQRLETLRFVNVILGAGRDALARTYVSLASHAGDPLPGQLVPPGPIPPPGAAETGGTSETRTGGRAGDDGSGGSARLTEDGSGAAGAGVAPDEHSVVHAAMHGPVGVITLDDRHKRNAIGARMANSIVAALGSMRAQKVRTVVIRAAAGMSVWSAGHDIDELPRGRRDPLGYDDPLEGLLRAIRTFPAPVVAMVHGTVWGGALDLVLSCDLVIADETASFAITPANLGLPYNTTGLLHFVGRLPINLIKEMFFTAAPLNAREAKELMVVNHLVPAAELEARTFELAETMAAKSPMAMAVIKEQLRVLTDYQPIAAQVYERLQGLRRQAYDSSDYLEGLTAFAEKRKPVFRGT
jgi:methylmalonyl-CoA decarboxylase